MGKTLCLILEKIWHTNRWLILNWLLYSLFVFSFSTLWVLLPEYISAALSEKGNSLLIPCALGIIASVCAFLSTYLKNDAWMRLNNSRYSILLDLISASLHIPFSKSLDEKYLDELEKARQATMNPSIGIGCIMSSMYDLLATILSSIGMFWIIGRISVTLGVIVLLSVLFSFYLQHLIERKGEIEWKETTDSRRKFEKSFNVLMEESAAKDIRLFSLTGLMEDYGNRFSDVIESIQRKTEISKVRLQIYMLINEAIRDVAVFSILAVATFQEKLSVGEFLTYSIGVLQLSLFIQSLLSLCSKLAKENSRFSGFWTILNEADMDVPIPVKNNTELEGLFTLDFENVSFRYPNSNQYAIQNISFHIKAGSQVAMVGTNGAGKSTIIKLICRLFTPESGTIKLNGVDIEAIPIDEYYSILSVVLQTGSLLPYSIENNITLSEQTDLERYNPALELSEFYRVQNNLPSGKYTMVSHIMDENGIDLSGGERQKLLLARAIYHGGKVYLFDEPSGAIDPLAEERIYNNYRLITKNSTSIIISHQLSFVSLCDHIILLKNGKICEEGNHEELMEKKGIYYEMYISQKRQYEE